MLARTVQVLYDRPVKVGPDLVGDTAPLGLEGSDASLKVHLTMLTLEDRTRVWQAIQRPYRLSVIYEVRLIELDSEQQQARATVLSRDLVEAVPS